jgi:hypothetical protein
MTTQFRELTTAAEVFEALGGVGNVAGLTGRKYGAAHNWKAFGKFPADTFVVMQGALEAAECTAPAALWGMVSIAGSAEDAEPAEART